MLINSANLRSAYVGFSAAFQGGWNSIAPTWNQIAMEVPSTTRSNEYGWLGDMPQVREWIGERQIQNLGSYGYVIRNRDWELTIGVDRNDFDDDNLGIYRPIFNGLGIRGRQFNDRLCWPLLNAGFTTPCYDRQYFFDTDHPVIDEAGNEVSVSNFGGGTGKPWFLMDSKTGFMPLILQTRKDWEFVRMDAATDEVVFREKKLRYGMDARSNVGFGMWQMIYGSRQPLTPDSYDAARTALTTMKGNGGVPLGFTPDTLIVDPTNDRAARKILMNDKSAGGESNEFRDSARLVMSPWLAT